MKLNDDNFPIIVSHVRQLVILLLNYFPHISIVDIAAFELNKERKILRTQSILFLPITILFLIKRFAVIQADLFLKKTSLFHVVRYSIISSLSIISSENEEDIRIRFYIA
jgi:hypothetical protein